MLEQADVDAGVAPGRDNDRVQGFDPSAAGIVLGRRKLGVDRRIGLVEALVLRPQQAIQHPVDLAWIRFQVRKRLPAHTVLLHHLHQAAGVDTDFGQVDSGRW